MRYARTMGVAVLLLLLLLLAPVRAHSQPEDDPMVAIQTVLDRRMAAVESGDLDAFLATIDPEAPDAFVEAQERHFEGLRSIPLDHYSLEADEDSGDLSPPGLGDARYGGARTLIPETTQRHRIRSYDDRDALDALWLTYVERDGAWFVGGDNDLEAVGLPTARAIWDLGPVRLLPTEHFLVIGHPDTARRADDLGRLAEQALARHRRLWDRPWSERLPIVLPSSVDELEVLLQSTFDLDNFVAFVGYQIDLDAPGGYAAAAPRMFIQDRNLVERNEDVQIDILVHELVHAATTPHDGPFIDAWVHEGVADWVAEGRPSGEQPPEGSDGRLPDPFELRTGEGVDIRTSYDESRSAISFLAATAGPTAPAELFAALGSVRVAPGSVDHHVSRALQATTGRDLSSFQKAWADQ